MSQNVSNSSPTTVRKVDGWASFRAVLALLRHARTSKSAFLYATLFSSLGMFVEMSIAMVVVLFLNVIVTGTLPPQVISSFEFEIAVPAIAWQSRTSAIFILGAGLVICSALKNIFDILGKIIAAKYIFAVGSEIREKGFSRLLAFGKAYFDGAPSSENYNKLINQTELLTFRLMELRNILSAVIMGAGYLTLLSILSLRLTLLTCLMSVPFLWILKRLRKRTRQNSNFYTETLARLSAVLTEFVANFPLIISYGEKKKESSVIEKASAAFGRAEYRLGKDAYLSGAIQEAGSNLLMMFLAFLAYKIMIVAGSESGGKYITYFVVLRRLKDSHYVITLTQSVLDRLYGPATALLEIFDDRDKAFIPDGSETFHGLSQAIEFRNASFGYLAGRPALKNASFHIEKGKTVAIVGSSGSGKSTIISLLQRFYDCAPETIFLDGVDIRKFKIDSVRSKISVVSQDIFLFNSSIRDNLTYGLNRTVSETEWQELLNKYCLAELVARLPKGLDTLIGDRGVQLSGGEKQRLSIARAILRNSELVLLDEATSALETETERAIQASLASLHLHQTVILISHRLSTMLHVDKIVVLEDGCVIEQGSPAELLARRGRFFELYTFQSIDSPLPKTG